MEEVVEFNNAEVRHGRDVARSLGIPASVLDSPDRDIFEEELKALMQRRDRI